MNPSSFLDSVAMSQFRSKRFQNTNVGQFYALMRPIVILGNCVGMMPLKNFASKEPLKVKFTVKSINFFYSLLVQGAIFTLAATSFYKQVTYEVEYGKLSKFCVKGGFTWSRVTLS